MQSVPSTKTQPRRLLGVCVAVGCLYHGGVASADGEACALTDVAPDGLHISETVYEGVGFAGVEFGNTAEQVEDLLGEAKGGSEHSLKYKNSRMGLCLCGGKVKHFNFHQDFKGTLYTSGLGIGHTLGDVEAAYGEIPKERLVDELCAWRLDRTLLIRRGGPQDGDGAVSKLHYYDAGVYFLFGEDGRIVGFGLFRKTNYAGSGQAPDPTRTRTR